MAFFRAADVTELAMQLEKNGEAFYRAVAQKLDLPQVQALFNDLADQEVMHFKIFSRLAQSLHEQPFMTDEEWDQYQSYLESTVQSAFFEGPDKALSVADLVRDEQEALGMAMRFEKETMLFFFDLRDVVPEKDRETITRVIAEEKKHLQRLAGMVRR